MPIARILGLILGLQGAYNFMLNVPKTSITAADKNLVDILNHNCPCGGTWEVNVTRHLTYCEFCLVPFVQPGDIGVPGFGVIRRYGDELRFASCARASRHRSPPCSISQMDYDMHTGYNFPLTVDDLPTFAVSFCVKNSPSYEYRGTFYQSCIADAYSGFDLTGIWNIRNDSNLYYYARSFYKLGSGCPDSVQYPQIVVYESGSYELGANSTIIEYGVNFHRNITSLSVIVNDADGLAYLQAYCPCGGIWKLGTDFDVLNCPANSCNDTTLLRSPAGLRRTVRVSMFSSRRSYQRLRHWPDSGHDAALHAVRCHPGNGLQREVRAVRLYVRQVRRAHVLPVPAGPPPPRRLIGLHMR